MDLFSCQTCASAYRPPSLYELQIGEAGVCVLRPSSSIHGSRCGPLSSRRSRSAGAVLTSRVVSCRKNPLADAKFERNIALMIAFNALRLGHRTEGQNTQIEVK